MKKAWIFQGGWDGHEPKLTSARFAGMLEKHGFETRILDSLEPLADLEALMQLLRSDIPCIGVMKGTGPASGLIRKLGLGDVYTQRAEQLRLWMHADEDTVLYECAQFDPEGLRLAREWVGQYCK
jgi:hypothetical protein